MHAGWSAAGNGVRLAMLRAARDDCWEAVRRPEGRRVEHGSDFVCTGVRVPAFRGCKHARAVPKDSVRRLQDPVAGLSEYVDACCAPDFCHCNNYHSIHSLLLGAGGRDLIKRMLNTDPNARYTIPKIRQHLWYRQIEEEVVPTEYINLAPESVLDEIHNRALQVLQDLGAARKAVLDGLATKQFNSATAGYFLVRNKLCRERMLAEPRQAALENVHAEADNQLATNGTLVLAQALTEDAAIADTPPAIPALDTENVPADGVAGSSSSSQQVSVDRSAATLPAEASTSPPAGAAAKQPTDAAHADAAAAAQLVPPHAESQAISESAAAVGSSTSGEANHLQPEFSPDGQDAAPPAVAASTVVQPPDNSDGVDKGSESVPATLLSPRPAAHAEPVPPARTATTSPHKFTTPSKSVVPRLRLQQLRKVYKAFVSNHSNRRSPAAPSTSTTSRRPAPRLMGLRTTARADEPMMTAVINNVPLTPRTPPAHTKHSTKRPSLQLDHHSAANKPPIQPAAPPANSTSLATSRPAEAVNDFVAASGTAPKPPAQPMSSRAKK